MFRALTVLGRLRHGISTQRANTELSSILARAHTCFVSMPPFAFVSLSSVVAAGLPTQLGIVSAAVGLLLLVACANVTTLVLARIESRRRDVAVSRAIGASSFRVIGNVTSETLLISAAGAAIGVLISWQAGVAAKALTSGLLSLDSAVIDLRVLTFATALMMTMGLLVGLAPAVRCTRSDPAPLLQASNTASLNPGGIPFASVLVSTQIAFAVALVIVGALLARAFERSVSADADFATDRILTAEISLDRAAYWRPDMSARYFSMVLERLARLPGVERVALVTTVPGGEFQGATGVRVEGRFAMVGSATISPDYFDVLSIPVVAGASFSEQDTRTSPPVVVVNAALARKYWESPVQAIGQTIAMGQFSTRTASGEFVKRDLEWTIVGVVADSRDSAAGTLPQPKVYSPYTSS